VQVSAHGKPLAATWFGSEARLVLADAHRPIAAGQSVVLYDDDVVLGAAVVA
jgi:tRNA U34 2-thiouridine synthase MnmA/TrmU